jgi:hypothetical protein
MKRDKTKKHNHLAAAEMSAEGNFNMIDGIINNDKPSLLEQMAAYERNIALHIEKDNERRREDDCGER